MRIVGIDEAGLGPLLGPLVAGAVCLEVERYDAAALWEAVGRDFGIADSKTVLSHRTMAPGEETVLAFLSLAGQYPATRRELFEGLVLSAPALDAPSGGEARPRLPAEAPCRGPGGPIPACRPDEAPLPRWASGRGRARAEELRARLASCGARLVSARAVFACPGELNAAFSAGVSKGTVDFRLFARLLGAERADRDSDDRVAYCGKIGGRNRYEELLQELGLTSLIVESRGRSAYRVQGLGQVEFLVSAEGKHLAVAMASMVAKLVREHLLDQWHTMLAAAHDGELASCSGYRDPVTKRYVEATESTRKRLGIPGCCFLRER